MKKQLVVLVVITLFCFNSYSQNEYLKGYYIDNNNETTECLIKNLDWLNNPTEIEYKTSENSESKKISISNCMEFGISGISRFIRVNVLIDRSSNDINKLTFEKKAQYNQEQLFLKMLIEGKASLFQYRSDGLNRFFYNINDSEIAQLEFKRYKINDTQIATNDSYKQELWNKLRCSDINISDIERIKYDERDLANLFEKYNKCEGVQGKNYFTRKKIGKINLSIRPGLNFVSNDIQTLNQSFDDRSELNIRFGIEVESTLSFNNDKWSIFAELNYQQFSYSDNVYGQDINFNYKSFELPIGFRHYMFLNKKSKIFINAMYVFDFKLGSSIEFEMNRDLGIEGASYPALGLGFNFNNKYSVEVRYGMEREILNDPSWKSNYNNISFILGYNFL